MKVNIEISIPYEEEILSFTYKNTKAQLLIGERGITLFLGNNKGYLILGDVNKKVLEEIIDFILKSY